MIKYRFTHMASTMIKAAAVIQLVLRVAGMATIRIGNRIPAILAKRVHQPYSPGLNHLWISSLSHFSDPNQLVKYSENVK